MRPSLDDLRKARPDLALAVYAMEPGQSVTLEIYADGHVYTFTGATEADAILAAFPQEAAPPEAPSTPQLPDSVFD